MRLRVAAPAALFFLAAPAFAQTPTALDDVPLVQRYQATITPAELAGHLYVYADDFLAGRDTGEPGQRFAADYLAGQYATMGIAPKGSDADAGNYGLAPYKQTFALTNSRLVSFTYTATRNGETLAAGALPSEGGATIELVPYQGQMESGTGPLVWVGDGTSTDDFDLNGAFVIAAITGEDSMEQILDAMTGRGVRGIVLPASPTVAPFQRVAARATRGSLSMAGPDEGSPALYLTGLDVAGRLLGTPGAALADMLAMPVGPTGTTITVAAEQERSAVETENVVAFIEGSDPALLDEVVVLSAHLDHVGDDGSGEDAIYNGADDDGSGTVSILEIAEAFQQAKLDGNGPRRSVLLLHVTGEEKGLFGSAYYADVDPRVPIANTVANLNIDMIGRYDPERGFETTDYVYIIGGDLISQDIADWNAAVNEATGTDLFLSDRFNSPDDPNQFFRRSDHWNFGKHDVPFIFYFTGTHEDYHGVGDHADKIDYDRLARIARLVFGTAWELANRDERPAVSGVGFN